MQPMLGVRADKKGDSLWECGNCKIFVLFCSSIFSWRGVGWEGAVPLLQMLVSFGAMVSFQQLSC